MKIRLMLLTVLALSRVPAFATEPVEWFGTSRIVPAFREGMCLGLKLVSVDPASVFATSGVVSGDVLHAVNGHAVTRPDGLMTAFESTRGTDHADLEVYRGERTVHLQVTLRSKGAPQP